MVKNIIIFSLILLSLCTAANASLSDAESAVRALAESKKKYMDIGVSFRHIETGKGFVIENSKSYPLASAYKLPLMLCVLKKCESGDMSLKDMIEIRNADRCIGSGDLQYAPAGKKYSLSHLIYEMMSSSDNTAADAIFNRLKRNETMNFLKACGILHTNIYIANRPSWLLSLGEYSDFKGMSSYEIASKWMGMSSRERFYAIDKVNDENSSLTIAQFQSIEDASESSGTYAGDVAIAEALDNTGTPSDFTGMLSSLWKGTVLDKSMREKALYYLASCKYNSRIPGRLPKGTKVWHKTGTIRGCVNDAGIIEFSSSSHGAIAVFVRNISDGSQKEAADAIAEISKIIYEACR